MLQKNWPYIAIFLIGVNLLSCSHFKSSVTRPQKRSMRSSARGVSPFKQQYNRDRESSSSGPGQAVRGQLPEQVSESMSERNWRIIKELNFIWPAQSTKRLSSFWGKRYGRFHHGIDIAAPRGSKVLAVQKGKVIHAGRGLGGYGITLVIGHGHGIFTVYAHLNRIYVRKGEMISQAQIIGEVGNTGRSSGPHLHFEIRLDGKSQDPMRFFEKSLYSDYLK